MATWKGTCWLLLGHVQTPQQLDPEVLVDHVVHVLPVGGEGRVRAQLAVEDHHVLAQHVPGDPDLPPMPGLHHDMVIPTDSLKTTLVPITCPKPSLPTPLILKDDDELPLGQGHVPVVEVLGQSMTRHRLST